MFVESYCTRHIRWKRILYLEEGSGRGTLGIGPVSSRLRQEWTGSDSEEEQRGGAEGEGEKGGEGIFSEYAVGSSVRLPAGRRDADARDESAESQAGEEGEEGAAPPCVRASGGEGAHASGEGVQQEDDRRDFGRVFGADRRVPEHLRHEKGGDQTAGRGRSPSEL